MSSEATVLASLTIIKDDFEYSSQPVSFTADIATANGPYPGAITVSTAGTDIPLSQLTQPGLCRIQNIDATNFVDVGIYDGSEYFPFMELLPGESFVFRISRFAPGPGTADTYYLRGRANAASCILKVEAFDT